MNDAHSEAIRIIEALSKLVPDDEVIDDPEEIEEKAAELSYWAREYLANMMDT